MEPETAGYAEVQIAKLIADQMGEGVETFANDPAFSAASFQSTQPALVLAARFKLIVSKLRHSQPIFLARMDPSGERQAWRAMRKQSGNSMLNRMLKPTFFVFVGMPPSTATRLASVPGYVGRKAGWDHAAAGSESGAYGDPVPLSVARPAMERFITNVQAGPGNAVAAWDNFISLHKLAHGEGYMGSGSLEDRYERMEERVQRRMPRRIQHQFNRGMRRFARAIEDGPEYEENLPEDSPWEAYDNYIRDERGLIRRGMDPDEDRGELRDAYRAHRREGEMVRRGFMQAGPIEAEAAAALEVGLFGSKKRKAKRAAKAAAAAAEAEASQGFTLVGFVDDYGNFRKYGDTIITNPAFLNAPQADFGPDLGDPHDVAEGYEEEGLLKYGTTMITNPAFLNSAQDMYGGDLANPHDVAEGFVVIGRAW